MSENLVSKLPEGWQQFLSEVHEHSLETKVREPNHFVDIRDTKHEPTFSCAIIMDALPPELRAKILTPCTGLKEKSAHKTNASTAAVNLQDALDEHDCLPENVLENFDPDDRVLYLDTQSLWSFEIGSKYWVKTQSDVEAARYREHMRIKIVVGLKTGLLTSINVITGVGFTALREHLPGEMFDRALNAVRTESQQRHENELPSMSNEEHDAIWLGVVTPEELVKYVPLDHIYAGVIVPMAEHNQFVDMPEPAAVSQTDRSPEVTVGAEEEVEVALESLQRPPMVESDSPKA
jgi:hypothetical protein